MRSRPRQLRLLTACLLLAVSQLLQLAAATARSNAGLQGLPQPPRLARVALRQHSTRRPAADLWAPKASTPAGGADAQAQRRPSVPQLRGASRRLLAESAEGRVAYIAPNQAAEWNEANATFNSLLVALAHAERFDTLKLTSDYRVRLPPSQPGGRTRYPVPVTLSRNITITSDRAGPHQLEFNFIDGAVIVAANAAVTLHGLAAGRTSRNTVQNVFMPFFDGEGRVLAHDIVRLRYGCTTNRSRTVEMVEAMPRPPGVTGPQQIEVLPEYDYRGTVYPNSIRAVDLTVIATPEDAEDARFRGVFLSQRNVTRVCLNYLPEGCTLGSDACLSLLIDELLAGDEAAARAAAAAAQREALLRSAVPAAVVGGVAAAAGAAGLLAWGARRRRRRRAAAAAAAAAAADPEKSARDASAAGKPAAPNRSALRPGGGGGGGQGGPGGCGGGASDGEGHSSDSVPGRITSAFVGGAVGSIEEVAIGSCGPATGWQLMACHTSPEFSDATEKDHIQLGVLLGVGSFGRVYRGRWRNMDVAVKVLHHDSCTAEAVSREVDLCMSFRHENITHAFHFVTWNHVGAPAAAAAPAASSPSQAGAGASSDAGRQALGAGSVDAERPSGGLGQQPAQPQHVPGLQRAAGGQEQEQEQGGLAPTQFVPLSPAGSAAAAAHAAPPLSAPPSARVCGLCSWAAGAGAAGGAANGAAPYGGGSGSVLLNGRLMPLLQAAASNDEDAGLQRYEQLPVGGGAQQLAAAAAARAQVQPLTASQLHQQLEALKQHQRERLALEQQQQQPQHAAQAQLVCGHSCNGNGLLPAPSPAPALGRRSGTRSGAPTASSNGSSNRSSGAGGGRSSSAQCEAQTLLILELCDTTLLDVLQEGRLVSRQTGQVNLAHVLVLLRDVARGMRYLHARSICHGDLKPGNVLLRAQQGAPFGHIAKVTDFGMSRALAPAQSHRSTRTMGTVNHQPPELLRLGRLAPAGDIFAFAVVMWELFTGQIAFAGRHYGEVFERVAILQERRPLPPDMPADYAELMQAAWATDPLARPSFAAIEARLDAMLAQLAQGEAGVHERFVADL